MSFFQNMYNGEPAGLAYIFGRFSGDWDNPGTGGGNGGNGGNTDYEMANEEMCNASTGNTTIHVRHTDKDYLRFTVVVCEDTDVDVSFGFTTSWVPEPVTIKIRAVLNDDSIVEVEDTLTYSGWSAKSISYSGQIVSKSYYNDDHISWGEIKYFDVKLISPEDATPTLDSAL